MYLKEFLLFKNLSNFICRNDGFYFSGLITFQSLITEIESMETIISKIKSVVQEELQAERTTQNSVSSCFIGGIEFACNSIELQVSGNSNSNSFCSRKHSLFYFKLKFQSENRFCETYSAIEII